jgi:hypothetical protein
MFWGSFLYDKKGPYYIWEKETAQQKQERKANLDTKNTLIKKANKQKWEK